MVSLSGVLTMVGGGGRSLQERALCARLVTQKAVMGRALSFEYLNRQLVWHELSELMLFVLPLLRVSHLKRMLRTHLPSLAAVLQTPAATGATPCPPPDPGHVDERQVLCLRLISVPCEPLKYAAEGVL